MKPGRPRLTPPRALAAYALLFSVFIGWASLRSALGEDHHGSAGRALAFVELAGAVCFAWSQTRLIGLLVLLAVFALAAVVAIHLGGWPGTFVFYAGSALFVQYLSGVVQGPNRPLS